MAPDPCEIVTSQIIPSKEVLFQCQIVSRLKVSEGEAHYTLKCCVETGSVVSKTQSGRPNVTTLIHQTLFTGR